MGFKDAEWATTTLLPMKNKVVLIAVCLRTNDKTHQTFVGQQTIADMIGASRDKVGDALGDLEDLGVITRERRNTAAGHRTSDLVTVNLTYAGNDLGGESPSRQIPTQETAPDLSGNLPVPMPESTAAKVNNQMIIQEITQSPEAELSSLFDTIWNHWPRKAGKAEARTRFLKVNPKDIDAVCIGVVAHGAAYAQWPKNEQQYVPHLATWLNKQRWADEELPLPRNGGTKTDAGRAAHEELMRRAALDEQKELAR